ncbi:MAG: hypothetical protein HC897_16555 [Thermoanaerobaculia bacterium]|nr:hypothetical protein [Thermoanaerobaculia bacterium]
MVFSTGPLISALLASAALPMIFSPVEFEGRIYADGGIVNNFPVERLSGLCDVIVGSYAGPLRAVTPEEVDNTLEVAERALDIGIFLASRAKFHACDVLLCPTELAHFGTLGSRNIDEIYEIGHRAASEKIDAIQEALAARR